MPVFVAWIQLRRFAAFTTDDAYISYRYAENLASGHGLVYNVGERVEGYTNFLFTVLLAAGRVLGFQASTTAKALGVASGLGVVALTYFLAVTLWKAEAAKHAQAKAALPWFVMAPWLLALDSAFLSHCVAGLETGLFTLLVVAGTFLMVREEQSSSRGRRWPGWSTLPFAAAALTRPEGVVYFALLMMFRMRRTQPAARTGFALRGGADAVLLVLVLVAMAGFHLRSQFASQYLVAKLGLVLMGAAMVVGGIAAFPARGERGLWAAVGVVVTVAGAHFLFRHLYYGAWLPNTLAAKTGSAIQQWQSGATYLKNFWDNWAPLSFLAVIGALCAPRRGSLLSSSAAATMSFAVGYFLFVGGDWMPFFRYLVPFVPFFLLLVEAAVAAIMLRAPGRLRVSLAIVGVALLVHRAEAAERDRSYLFEQHAKVWEKLTHPVSHWLNANGRPGALAIADIGEVGYRTNRPVFDLLGLVTPKIAELPGGYASKDLDRLADAFFAAQPAYAVWGTPEPTCTLPSHPMMVRLYRDPRFRKQYRLRFVGPWAGSENWCIHERVE